MGNKIFIDIVDYKILDIEHKEEIVLFITERDDVISKNNKVKIILEREYKGSQSVRANTPLRNIPEPSIKELYITDSLKSLVKFLRKERDKFIIEYKSLSKLEKPVEDFLIMHLKLMGAK